MSAGAGTARRVREARPPRPAIDPWSHLGVTVEAERGLDGRRETAATVFLAGAECPFTCVYCDLWRHTLEGPTPPGALPRQLEAAWEELAAAGHPVASLARIKLYNASNFFEPRAVPREDQSRLLELLAPAREVTVECHPRLVGEEALAFAAELPGRLEVAMGLETVHPEAFPRLHKGMELADFAAAAQRLRKAGCGVRAFVLVGAPFVPAAESVPWAVRSVTWAVEQGAERVALIPTRGGNGEMERLQAAGAFTPPCLADLEAALDRALAAVGDSAVVSADLWDLEAFAPCTHCREPRRRRLEALNLDGRPRPRVECGVCGAA